MSHLRSFALVALVALGTPGPFAASARAQSVGRAVGDFFPDLELPTIEGDRTVRLSQLEGKRLLLIEFASW